MNSFFRTILSSLRCVCGGVAVALALLASSCGPSEAMRRLQAADAIIEADPYAAMDTLITVSPEGLSARESAYRALLYTQAQIKTWIRVDSDTLINIAYDYYRDRDEGDRTIRAHFYKAKVADNAGKMRESMRGAVAAYEMAREQELPYWIARSAELISDLFFDSYNYPQAEEFSRITVANYGLAGREASRRYAIVDLAMILKNVGKRKRAFELLDSLRNICLNEEPVDSAILNYLREPFINSFIRDGLYDSIPSEEIDSLFSHKNRFATLLNYSTKSNIYKLAGNTEAAKDLLEKSKFLARDDRELTLALYAIYENARDNGRFEEAVELCDSIIMMQNKVAADIVKESVALAKSDFYSDRASSLLKDKRRAYAILLTVALIALLIIIMSWAVYRYRMLYKKAEYESVVTSLLHDMERHRADDRIIAGLFREQWTTINMLCDEYFEKCDNEKSRGSIIARIERELQKQKSEQNQKEIEEKVDRFLGGIMTGIRRQCPSLTESEINFITLKLAGFSIRAICYFNEIKYKTFHNKKNRILAKIAASEAPDKDHFIEALQ